MTDQNTVSIRCATCSRELSCGLRWINSQDEVCGFGERGVSAEQVAARVYAEVRSYLAEVPVWKHLVDQFLLPMTLARHGRFSTGPLTPHFGKSSNCAMSAGRLPYRSNRKRIAQTSLRACC